MALYSERGFEKATVAEIAERAGVTERTFFRHYGDKREVLFKGSGALEELVVSAVLSAPTSLPPLQAVALGLEAAADLLESRRDFARQRHAIIGATSELRERELIKLASLSAALAGALRQRRVREPDASLAAEAGVAVFQIAFDRWVSDDNQKQLRQLIGESLRRLKVVTQ